MQELAIAEKLARQAGHIALGYQHLGVLHYKDNFEGPVTQGDILADKLIVSGLQEAFPLDQVVSEESFRPDAELPQGERVWFVDPIDGTSDYSKGGNEYAVMIGLCIHGVPALGVIYEPATGVLWRGFEDQAERVDADGRVTTLNIKESPMPLESLRLAVSHSWSSVIPAQAGIQSWTPAFAGVTGVEAGVTFLRKSSVGLKAAMVADGHADAYVSIGRRIKVWDTCAPAALVMASGGVFMAISGEPLRYTGSAKHGVEIMAASPHAAPRIENLWNSLKKTKKS